MYQQKLLTNKNLKPDYKWHINYINRTTYGYFMAKWCHMNFMAKWCHMNFMAKWCHMNFSLLSLS